LNPLKYRNAPYLFVTNEGYHYKHYCDRNGWKTGWEIMKNTLEREIQQKTQAFRDVMLHHWGKVSLYSKKIECLQF
jgi:hypothetical protein